MLSNIKNNIKEIIQDRNSIILIILSMFYVSCKLTCNPLFFRQINIFNSWFPFKLTIISSTLIFPIIYILSDLIYTISNRTTVFIIITIGIICDGFFSFVVKYITSLPVPNNMSPTQLINGTAINILGENIWQLFLHGLIASVIANIAEVLIFIIIFKKINNFFISTIISVFIILLFHNIITDYPMMSNQYNVWQIIFGGLGVNMTILIFYAAIISMVLWAKKKYFS